MSYYEMPDSFLVIFIAGILTAIVTVSIIFLAKTLGLWFILLILSIWAILSNISWHKEQRQEKEMEGWYKED